MPEGPEVRTVAVSLNEKLGSKNLYLFNIEWDEFSKFNDYNKSSVLINFDKIEVLLPAQIIGITCKGKRLIFIFISNNNEYFYMTSHFNMEGRWTWIKGNHSNFWLKISEKDHNNDMILYFDDTRHFGNIKFHLNTLDLVNFLDNEHGPDLLAYAIDYFNNQSNVNDDEKITSELWKSKLKNNRIKNKQICDFLMNQKYFCGIGNYLKSEILYESKIKPDRILSSLSDDEIEKLRISSLTIIYQSFIYGGLTIKSFWDPNGISGRFSTKVYNQSFDPNGYKILSDVFKDKRTTYWVPEIQV